MAEKSASYRFSEVGDAWPVLLGVFGVVNGFPWPPPSPPPLTPLAYF